MLILPLMQHLHPRCCEIGTSVVNVLRSWSVEENVTKVLQNKVALLGISALVLGALLSFYYSNQREEERIRWQELARTRIKNHDIDLVHSDLKLSQVSFVEGDILNKSAYTVNNISLHIKVFDCPDEKLSEVMAAGEPCNILAEKTTTLELTIPPGQQKAFEKFVRFSSLPPLTGEWSWRGRIAGYDPVVD
jgi:hypothetical protein